MKKLFLSLLLVLLPLVASAHDFEVNGIYYRITDNEKLTVGVTYRGTSASSYKNEYWRNVVIPETVTFYSDLWTSKTYNVTSIEHGAFSECSELTSVTIPNSVTSIGNSAFSECSELTSVTIPNSVTSIGSFAFNYCSSLTSVTIPNSVTSIGSDAFNYCSSLTSVTIPNSVTSIGSDAFNGTAWYNNQPDGVIYAGKVAYKYKGTMPSNTSIELAEGTLGIAGSAFSGCSSLTSITIPNSVTSIGNSAFSGCSSLTSITIPNSVTSIGNSAFYYCSSLTSVTIPNSVTSIGNSAFYDCSSLTSVTIPNSVTSIGNNAFIGCSGLTSVTIPNSVTSIGNNAFKNCSGLTSLTIGSGVTSIGSDAFYGCSGLTININTKNLKNWFSGCSSIENIVLGNDVENIENGALNNMPNLKTVTIGTGMLSIGTKQTAPKITLWLPNTPPKGYENLNGKINYVANEQYTGLNEMYVYKYLSSLFDADGIKYVPVNPSNRTCDALFCFDKNITNAIINKTVSFKNVAMNVNNVMPYAYYKHNIKTASLYNDGLIGDRIFSDCTSLESIHLGDSVTSIGNYAFNNCSSLTEISIPKATTSIGDYAFSGCKNITNVIIEDKDGETELTLGSNGSKALFSDCPLDSVYIGGNIKYNTSSSYGYSPFYRNTSLRTVVITDKEDEIYANEFYGCTNLKNVQIGDGVKSIGDWAFSGCSNLDYFAFGTGLQSIGKEAFSDCVNVTKLISYAVAPPKCGEMALDDINKWNCTLQIPQQSLAAYQAADQWKEFFFIEGFDATGIEGVTADNPSLNAKANVYTLDGTLIKGNANISDLSNELPKGIYIVNGKKFYVK